MTVRAHVTYVTTRTSSSSPTTIVTPTTQSETTETLFTVGGPTARRHMRNRFGNRRRKRPRKGESDKAVTCLKENGVDYRGAKSYASNGATCKHWSSLNSRSRFHPRRHPSKGLDANYCRNPDGDLAGPWCYVQIWPRKRYLHCNIEQCDQVNNRAIVPHNPLTNFTEPKSESSSMINERHSERSNEVKSFAERMAELADLLDS